MNQRNVLIFGGFLLLFAILVFVGASSYDRLNNDSANTDYPVVNISSNASYPYYSYEELAEKSDLIVVGKITRKETPKWSTKDGKQPAGVQIKESVNEHGDKVIDYYTDLLPGETIYTDMVYQIDESYKGKPGSDKIVIRSFGGTVGSFHMNDIDFLNPEDFNEKETVLLYLVKDDGSIKDIGPEHYVVLPGGKLTFADDVFIDQYGEKVDSKYLLSMV